MWGYKGGPTFINMRNGDRWHPINFAVNNVCVSTMPSIWFVLLGQYTEMLDCNHTPIEWPLTSVVGYVVVHGWLHPPLLSSLWHHDSSSVLDHSSAHHWNCTTHVYTKHSLERKINIPMLKYITGQRLMNSLLWHTVICFVSVQDTRMWQD